MPLLPSIRDIFPEMAKPLPSPPPDVARPSYSFNVLRADPVTASLEHVASSTTLRPRPAPSASAPPHAGLHGAAPVFRVAIAPSEQQRRHRPHRPVREILPDTRERPDALPPSIPREADLTHLRSPSSTILSFPISDHPLPSTASLITQDVRRLHLRSDIPVQPEGRGKKHQCPHCGKRFNRPSSMKIHVNTHTGAKPYRCPFPGCGREFNVNSNMRRHWRNHSRSAPVRIPDPDLARTPLYHPHHPHALMSPPATNSSASDGNSEDDDVYSDEEDGYPMDLDDNCDLGAREPHGDDPMRGLPPPIKGSTGSSSSSDWSRSASPARAPLSPPVYGHRPSHAVHARSHGQASEYLYRPSIPAYAISCTDSRVSTALRPAFTSTSPCSVRDRSDRYHARGGRYPSRG